MDGVVIEMKIGEIAEFIVKEYPNSCVASCGIAPSDFKNEYCEDMLVSYLMDFFAFEILNMCGCGIPENTYEVIRRVLNIRNEWSEDKLSYEDVQEKYKSELRVDTDISIDYGLLQFMLYTLDSAGLLEHGSSIGGCWLSSLGKMYLTVLNAWRKIEDTENEE